jgi:enamine deaminase RidA (YjgF/YER057c/UK114 family)
MRRYITEGEGLPRWSSPISHAVVVDDTCYLSGQLSLDAEGRYLPDTPANEARRAFGHLFSALRAAGFAPDDLAFVDITFANLSHVGQVNEVYASLFHEGRRPARTVCQVAALPFDGQVKVAGVAIRERTVPG